MTLPRLSTLQTTLMIAAGLAMLASLYFGLAYFSSRGDRAKLAAELAGLESRAAQISTSGELAQRAADDLALREPAFPADVPGVELMDLVVRSAGASGLRVTGVQASSVGTEQVGKNAYRTGRVSVQVRGDPQQVASFLDGLERTTVRTMVLDNIDVVQDGEVWDLALEVVSYARGS